MWGEHSTFVCQEHRPGGKGAVTRQPVMRTCLSTIYSLTLALGQASPLVHRALPGRTKGIGELTARRVLHPFGPVFHKATAHPQKSWLQPCLQ